MPRQPQNTFAALFKLAVRNNIRNYIPLISLCVLPALQSAAQAVADTAHALEQVVVTGQYAPQSLKQSVYKVRIINQQRIQQRAATDVVGVLNSELGIRFETDNTLSETNTKFFGMGSSRVKVLLDGVPLVDRDATKQSLTQIDINSIERIELVEGPMSTVYGTDALAGVVNIITKKHIQPGNNITITARVQEETMGNQYSPFANEGIHNENLSVNWNNHHLKAGAYATRNVYGGYGNNGGFPAKKFNPKTQWVGGGNIGCRNATLNAWYRLDYMNEELLYANPMNINNYISFQQYYVTKRYTHQAQVELKAGKHLNFNAAASFQDYTRNTESYNKNYQYGTETPNTTSAGYWDVSKFKSWFFRGAASWTINPIVSVQPGFDIKYDKTSGQRIKGTPEITDYAFFASAEIKPVKSINIRPGLRISKNSVYDAPPLIPSINTKFTLSKTLDLRVSYARGFRAPILRELYFNFFDANHSIQGNPDLKAEESNSYTLGFTYNPVVKSKDWRITSSISGFYNDFSNFIDLYGFKDASNNDVFSYFNREKNKTIGGIWENNIAWKDLNIAAGLSYTGYYNTLKAGTAIGDHVTFAFSPEVNANITYIIPSIKLNVGLFYKFTGKIPAFTLDTTGAVVRTQRDAFHWCDLSFSKNILKYFTIQAGVKNLFDVTTLNSTGPASSGAHSSGSTTNYTYGRSYFAGINFQFNKTYK